MTHTKQLTAHNSSNKPWYRHSGPWLLMAGPFIVVVAGLATAWIAAHNADELVADDYYKRGKTINMDLKRDTTASQMQLSADVFMSDDHRHIRLQNKGKPGFKSPAQLKLKLIHPTKMELDQEVLLQQHSGNMYEAKLKTAADGWRHVSIEDLENQWRLTATWRISQESTISITARPMQMPVNAAPR